MLGGAAAGCGAPVGVRAEGDRAGHARVVQQQRVHGGQRLELARREGPRVVPLRQRQCGLEEVLRDIFAAE
jgi:hypothetical protein